MAEDKMDSMAQKPRRVSTTLVRESTDWGVTVSEKRVRPVWLNTALLILSIFVLLCAFVIVLPLLAGLMLSAEITGITSKILIVAAVIGIAFFFNMQSRKGLRNALELDGNASELRLGFMNRYGAFVRRQVIPLTRVEDAFVGQDEEGQPELVFMVGGEQIRIALADAKAERLSEIAAQTCEAATRARNAPRRSRIRSAIAGIGAGYREIGDRVVSRIYH
ncbi:MAG: hypothetical protein ACR2O1_11440 [Boseongicola sp.]